MSKQTKQPKLNEHVITQRNHDLSKLWYDSTSIYLIYVYLFFSNESRISNLCDEN